MPPVELAPFGQHIASVPDMMRMVFAPCEFTGEEGTAGLLAWTSTTALEGYSRHPVFLYAFSGRINVSPSIERYRRWSLTCRSFCASIAPRSMLLTAHFNRTQRDTYGRDPGPGVTGLLSIGLPHVVVPTGQALAHCATARYPL